jgi:hypothetical protein
MIQIEATEEFDKWLKGLRDLQAKVRIFDRIRRLRDGNPGDVMRIKYVPAKGSITHSAVNRSSFCCVVAISHRRRKISPVPLRWRNGGTHET